MYKKTVTYEDFNGITRTEDFYFNISKAELLDLETSRNGGFSEYIKRIIDAQDMPTLVRTFREVVLLAYGEKDETGRRFVKSAEMAKAFSETNAFSEIYLELATDSDAAAEFVNGILPSSVTKPELSS